MALAPSATDRALRVRATDSARSAVAGDELVLLHLERGTYYSLSGTAVWIWQQIGNRPTLGELCSGLVERYSVHEARAWRELLDLLGEMEAEDLVAVEVEDSPAGR